MDFLRAYKDDDEEEEEEEEEDQQKQQPRQQLWQYTGSVPKRLRSDGPSHWAEPSPLLPRHRQPMPTPNPSSSPMPVRYVSKRERAAMASASPPFLEPMPLPPTPDAVTSPVVGSISCLPHGLLRSLQGDPKSSGDRGRCSGRVSVALKSSQKAVNSIQWSRSHAHLLASAGMDHMVSVWNVWNSENRLARIFSYHNAAVKDVRWSPEGFSLLSCGYDCSSRLVDIEKGVEKQVFREDQFVGAIRFHPGNPNLFLSGGSKGSLKLWDVRTGGAVKEYYRNLGTILDVEFSLDGRHFISSSDVSGTNISENAVIVWDVSRQIPLSNQVYAEAYTCPCVRYHPLDPSFIAQSNGNYIAIFSARPPFKLDKYKRFEKHAVSGFPIKCDFSLDGEEIASGSADGCMYFYDYKSSQLVRKVKVFDQACIDVAFHPCMPNVVASCSWTGDIAVFE